MKPMHSARIACYPCRIDRSATDWTVSFRDVPLALTRGRGVPGVFEAAESALVSALDILSADAALGGLPVASAPAPGEVVITVRLGGPPLVRTSPPETPAASGADTADEDLPAVSGEVVDVSTETGLVSVRREGFWGWFIGLFGGSRSS